MTDSEEDLAEQFEIVHDHLTRIDDALEAAADEFEETIEAELAEISVEVEHSIDEGVIQARLPLEEVARKLNAEMELPLFVESRGNKIIVNDARRRFDVDMETLNEAGLSKKGRVKKVKSVISSLEGNFEEGVPVEVIEYTLQIHGMDLEKGRHEIEKLRQKGEVYEPRTDCLRVT